MPSLLVSTLEPHLALPSLLVSELLSPVSPLAMYSAADDSPGQDLPGKSVKPPAWKRIHTKDNRSIILQWKVVPGTKTYKIYRSEKGKGEYTKIGSASASKCLFRDRKVKAGRTYYYKIQADNGAFSNVKKYAVNGMTAPEVIVRKKGSGRNVYLEFRVKKSRLP